MIYASNETHTDIPVYRMSNTDPGLEWFMSGVCFGAAFMGSAWIFCAWAC